ncbi:2,3-diphosphoglycerate-dependent phosphoglycerate mutase [Aromatoleum evansii]|uniref:2,3-bisphosphoglycerate-dependent phosphoglycerate mutase n=1 Tax=Aromatoleum evansii TaxID=59406 RepID=A0ABZ1AR57_AROEV|nr:2,3-diphosphoglycerate-dependent phosphoglycerate mutase [Aromatoleum evansii]
MYRIVLLRHGESTWNTENRFTGWADIDLTGKGVEEARAAGRLLRREGCAFDLAFTSVLKRANKTLNLVLEELDALWLPVEHSWRLNERSYGALQGQSKAETAARFGEEQVQAWRRSYDATPPALAEGDERLTMNDPRYASLPRAQFPRAESLKDTLVRLVPYWETVIVPQILAGRRVLIVAHGNSLRALVKHLDRLADEDVAGLEIPMAQPLVYELDANLRPIKSYALMDEDPMRPGQAGASVPGRIGS